MQLALQTSRKTPVPATRRGACPTLAAPMLTGDGLLVRLRPEGGELTIPALQALALAAQRFGNGRIEVTSRGNFQLRGIRAEAVATLETEILAVLDIETGVPVEFSPLAGIDPDELVDPRPLARRLRQTIADAGLAGRLSPKVTVVIEGGGRLRRDHLVADLRLEGQAAGWLLRFGGEQIAEGLSEDEVLVDAMERLQHLAAEGREARARDTRRAASGSVVPVVGRHALADGSLAVGLATGPAGSEAADLLGLADALEAIGAATVRLGFDHALFVVGLDPAQAGAVERAAATHGFVSDPSDPRLSIAACPGEGRCASSHIDTLSMAKNAQSALLDGSVILHVSGCAKGCAHTTPAALVIAGSEAGCRVIRDGRAGDPALATVRSDAVTPGLERLGRLYREGRHAQETASQWLRRVEPRVIADAFA